MAKKNTADTLIDIAGSLISGDQKGIGLGDLVEIGSSLAGIGSPKKKATTSEKKSAAVKKESQSDEGQYPSLTPQKYWAIREKLQKEMPEKLTAQSLATTLNLKKATIESGIYPDLQTLGLINSQGMPQTLANAWADDARYADACAKMLKQGYPADLRALPFRTKTERNAVVSWFRKNTDVSDAMTTKMADIYFVIASAELEGVSPAAKKTVPAVKKAPAVSEKSASEGDSLRVEKLKTGKVKIQMQLTVDEGIAVRELQALFDAAFEKTIKAMM